MAAWNSSSLAVSDSNNTSSGRGLLKKMPTRISKQHIAETKMFGSKRKGIQIGKKFKKVGKGILKGSVTPKMSPSMKGGGISPSIDQFDKMMANVTKSSKSGSGGIKSGASRKFFG